MAAPEPPSNLPAQLTSFVGRAREIEELLKLLGGAQPLTRLVTLTGAGGVGKTRLALEAAASLLPSSSYLDGAWLAELAPLGDPRRLPQLVAAVFGLQEESGRPFADVLVDALRPRRLLLLLDNCEHLVQPSAELAHAILRACPRVAILATSREPLGIVGETTRRVPSLDRPDARALPSLARLRESESVRLFCERATAVSADFDLTERNAVAVAQVCERLDGIPLALELAAARTRALSVEQIAARLDEAFGHRYSADSADRHGSDGGRFRLLGYGRRAAPARQQTLEAAVAWSYDLLNEDERRLFNRLSVFAGGGTLEDVEAICAGPEQPGSVLDLLVRLVEKSLVLADDGPDGAKWYRLQEPIRQFAADRLRASGEERAVRERHFEWYVRVAEAAEDHLRWITLPWGVRVQWMARLGQEFANLRTAWQWALDGEGRAEDGMRLTAALFPFFYSIGYVSEGRECLAALLTKDRGAAPTAARARALSAAAKLAAHHGDDAAVPPLADEYMALPEGLRAGRDTALVFNALGLVALHECDFPRARAHVAAALAEARAIGDTQTTSLYLSYLGQVAAGEGRPDEARALYGQALAAGRAADFPIAIGLALGGLARLARADGDRARTRGLYEQALSSLRDVGDMPQIALMLAELGHLALEEGDGALARARFAESLGMAVALGHRESLIAALEGIAVVLSAAAPRELRPIEAALRLLGAAARQREGTRLPPPDASVRPALAQARKVVGPGPADGLLAEGRGLALDEAAPLAAAALGDATADGPGARDPAAPALTRREREVLVLVARGCTNRQIADALVVAERTVEMHVSNILGKLGLASRVQVAAWAVGQGLLDDRPGTPTALHLPRTRSSR